MFNFITDAVENALDVATGIFTGDLTKRKVAKLVSDGVSIALIATAFGVAEDVVMEMLGDAHEPR